MSRFTAQKSGLGRVGIVVRQSPWLSLRVGNKLCSCVSETSCVAHMGSDVYIVGGRVPALRQREPDGEPERRRGAEETTTCAGDDQCSVVPTLPSFVSAVIDSPSTRAAASISEPSASNLSAPAGNR
jgi:hypothetical protein